MAGEREKIFKDLDKKAREYEALSRNCAQSSFSALSDQFGLGDGQIRKALTPFPGIALRGETCGVVTGCLLAMGLVFGRDRMDDWDGYLKSLPPARKFCRAFEKQFGSTMCGKVVEQLCGKSFNLASPPEADEWNKSGCSNKCGDVVAGGCRIAAEIILEKK